MNGEVNLFLAATNYTYRMTSIEITNLHCGINSMESPWLLLVWNSGGIGWALNQSAE